MKIQRRSCNKNTLAGGISLSFAGFFPGLITKGCNGKTSTIQKIMKKLIVKEIQHKGTWDLK